MVDFCTDLYRLFRSGFAERGLKHVILFLMPSVVRGIDVKLIIYEVAIAILTLIPGLCWW